MAPGDVVPKKEQDKVFSDFKDEEIQRLRAAKQEAERKYSDLVIAGWRPIGLLKEISDAFEIRGAGVVGRYVERLHEAESDLASLADFINIWAREDGVEQAESPKDAKKTLDMIWGRVSQKVSESQARCARLEAALLRIRDMTHKPDCDGWHTIQKGPLKGARSNDVPLFECPCMDLEDFPGAIAKVALSSPGPSPLEAVREAADYIEFGLTNPTTGKRMATALRAAFHLDKP